MDLKEMRAKLKKSLSETRYIHSLNVMEEAVKLAVHYNADVEKARIAGLRMIVRKTSVRMKKRDW